MSYCKLVSVLFLFSRSSCRNTTWVWQAWVPRGLETVDMGWRSNASVDHLSPIQRPTVDMPIQGLVFYCKHSSGIASLSCDPETEPRSIQPLRFFHKGEPIFWFSSRLTSCRVSFQWRHFRRSKLANQSEHLHACLIWTKRLMSEIEGCKVHKPGIGYSGL